ncbi:hypothetical protein BJV77DRAFT_1072315 [Russula vinacea]|nr:hypothetical protein BJV77DRAFT_1072315 [Russula vinacea]
MPAKSLNASPSSVHPTFDSHSILAQFEHSEAFVAHPDSVEDQRPETTQQHGPIRNPEVPINELGIYEASAYIENCLSPLEAFNETAEPIATHLPEKPLYQEPPGHIRSPILSKQPSRLEGLSRTVRNYVPTSISIAVPSASPSPPRVSLPISFGRFMSPTHQSAPLDGMGTDRRQSWGMETGATSLEEVLTLDHQTGQTSAQRSDLPRYPGSDDSECITWARWDALFPDGGGPTMRLLILAYSSGLQIWDCTNLDSISEMLNISSPEWGRVVHAEVLPNLPAAAGDEFLNSRPLLGMIAKHQHQGPDFLAYSLSTHKVVKKLSIPGIISFSANPNVIVISTSSPTSLRIVSSCTFMSLSTISSGLSTFIQPQSSSAPANSDTTLPTLTNIDTDGVSAWPHPVFALSHRFLAYTCRNSRNISPGQQTKSPVRAEGVGIQPDLGGMAMRVSGTVLSGMRALGGRALTAARARISDTLSTVPSKPLSRSAPEQETLKESDPGPAPKGCHVMVLDLESLASPSPRSPEPIVEFLASENQLISALRFSADGSALMVVPGDGQTVKVFQVRPLPRTLRFVGSTVERPDEGQNAFSESAPWHMYDLRRGRTSAVIENLDWATDGRWIAIATQKRTVHVFATNPYGGQPDGQSHVKGRVCNSPKLSLSTSLPPLVRLRTVQPPASRLPAPLTFIFIQSNAHSLPKRLLPSPSVVSPPSSTPSSVQSSPSREPLSPPHRRRRADFQDILIFDPADGSLSLRRCTINLRPVEQTLSVPNSVPGIGGTSISLPSRSSLGRVNAPFPAPAIALRSRSSGTAPVIDKPMAIAGHESQVATWNLRRGRGWPVVKGSVRPERHILETPNSTSAPNWLSFAELRTSSQSPQVLPRSLYLSHQFSFHALRDDYHGRLRRFQLDSLGPKIDVRKEVEISATHDTGHTSSSFDEPLSSAMSSGLGYPSSPPVIPMFPNGTPGSFKNSIPIQRVAAGLSDGMTEGFARVRREIGRVRSPRLSARHDVTAEVPLEFGEEDEEFVLSYGGDGVTSSRDDGVSVSVSTPSSDPVDAGERKENNGTWPNWGVGVQDGEDLGEQFHDISVVGLMDEEQALTKRRSRSPMR